MKKYFLRWLIYWADLLQGILGILSFGFWHPNLALKMAEIYSMEIFQKGDKGLK
jgi:hypothetical protein